MDQQAALNYAHRPLEHLQQGLSFPSGQLHEFVRAYPAEQRPGEDFTELNLGLSAA